MMKDGDMVATNH